MNPNTHAFRTGIYRVVPMHPAMAADAAALEAALIQGVVGERDPKRRDFYSIDVDGAAHYVHLFEPQRRMYLLSVTRPASRSEPPVAEGSMAVTSA